MGKQTMPLLMDWRVSGRLPRYVLAALLYALTSTADAEGGGAASEIISLEAGGQTFEAHYRPPTTSAPRGALIFLHGRRAPGETLVTPLYRLLAEKGYAGLAIDLPSEAESGGGWLTAGQDRVKAALAYLEQQKPKASAVALVGVDSGASVVLAAIQPANKLAAKAAVVIDPPAPRDDDDNAPSAAQIAGITLPLLEIRTRSSDPESEEAARASRARMKDNKDFRQSLITDPHADWKDVEEFLANRIHGWLSRAVPAQDAAAPANPN